MEIKNVIIFLKVPDRNTTQASDFFTDTFRVLDTYSRDEVKQYIQWYMIGMAVVAVGLLIAFSIYFPDKPPSPPSATSALPR